MKNTMFLAPEQEQKIKDAMLALDSLTYNTMCYGCKALHKTCGGTTSKFYGGCIYREPNGLNAIFGFARFVPELIKNEDFSSYDEFLEELRSNRAGVADWLESRARGEHFKNEVLTDKYITACKKILNILKEIQQL
jgi:hypothetical protein